tara:strand:+ start:1605 stop:1835 length:231 start_codon:yes stop_codon:yes gene_type:complete
MEMFFSMAYERTTFVLLKLAIRVSEQREAIPGFIFDARQNILIERDDRSSALTIACSLAPDPITKMFLLICIPIII